MKIAHLADLHFDEARYEECRASIETVITAHNTEQFDLIAIAGDIWHGSILNSARSRFYDFIELIRRLSDCAPVVMIYGTPSHDTEGSLEVFASLESQFGITIVKPGQPYFLDLSGMVSEKRDYDPVCGISTLLILGVPEPQKKWLLEGGEAIGKDATDEAVRNAMRALFLGLGGMRNEHINLPCLLLYHGQVSGARSGTGYTAGSGIAVSRDDLAMVGADYIAMGDIHEPQKLPDLPAYYPGSIYPQNWGETHQAGCNIVEIRRSGGVAFDGDDLVTAEGFEAQVSRLDFPHPRRLHIQATDSLDICKKMEFHHGSGKMVWLEIEASDETASDIDGEAVLEVLRTAGVLPGSRVSVKLIPTETVRAGEIAEKTRLRDKIGVWAENSSLDIPEPVLKKADELEAESLRSGLGIMAEKRFRNLSTFIRGAWGFYRRQKKDEVFIDWDSLGPGIHAYIGPNGFGKTTSIDFSKPWPVPVSRSPKTLWKHFRLRDSVIENVYLEELSGVKYKSTINIKSGMESSSAEYFLFQDKGNGWEPYPGINGRIDPYREAVEQVFGSLVMYLRTAYATQKATKDFPDLADATPEERKELIGELSGLEYLSEYASYAHEKQRSLDSLITEKSITIEAVRNAASLLPEKKYQLSQHRKELPEIEQKLDELKRLGTEKKKEVEELASLYASDQKKRDVITQFEQTIRMQESDIKKLRGEIESLSVAVAEKDETQKKIEDFETLKKAEKELNDEKANNLGKANSLRETLSGEQETLRLEEQAIAEARQKIAQELASLQNEKNLLAHTLEGMKKELELPLDENCPTCNQLLPEFTRMTLMEDRERKKDKAQSIEGKIVFLSEHLIPGLEKRIAENDQKQKELESRYEEKTRGMREELSRIDVKNRELHTAVSKIENELDWIDIDTLKGNLKKAESAAITSEELKKQIAVLSEKKNYNEIQAEEYRKELDDSLREKYSIAQIGLEELKEFYQNAQERKVRTESGILLYDTQVKEMEAQLSTVEGTVIECETMKQEHAEWELLERALNGVRDLELDALAPSIADTATKLLAESGDPGSFEIKTTRISGKGAKAKQIEDFLIYYTYDGVSQEIGTCSGGEMVWVRKAIYDAFAIIRAKNARVRFNTVFLDETDGALFPAARMNYYRMLKVAHETLNRYQTILVTQSSEVAAMAEKVIDVRELDTRRTA